MSLAIEQSRKGFPAPNPHVGCIIVKDGRVIGEGHHAFAGADHAEVMALKSCSETPEGAEAYVTLEPCNHFGRTPPCSQALIQAGIRRVIIATPDPNPVAKGGAEALKEAGVEVEFGVLDAQARMANEQFLFSITKGRPLVTIKAAISLDGKIALDSGESQWITGEAARRDGQALRAQRGCVLVGRATAEVDQARLTVRDHKVFNQPIRVVIDRTSKLPESLPIFNNEARTIRFTDHPRGEQQRKWIDLQNLLHELDQEGIRGVLVEGGAFTIAQFFKNDLVDEVVLYVAPKVFGQGKSWIDDYGIQELSEAKHFEVVSTEQLDPDLKIVLRSRNLLDFIASKTV